MRIGGYFFIAAAIGILAFSEAIIPRFYHQKDDGLRGNHIQAQSRRAKPKLNHNLIVNQYDILIKPYFEANDVTVDASRINTFDGETTVTFTMNSNANSIVIDAFELNIDYIKLKRNGFKMVLKYADYDEEIGRYTIVPIQFLFAGKTYSITFRYTGKIRDYRQGGLFYSTYKSSNGTDKNIYATHFETGIGAASVFPCFNDPHFKAQFNITIIAPKSLTVLSNTMENNGTDLGDGYRSVNFPLTNRQSTYLVAFAIGDLVSVSDRTNDGIEIRVWTWRETGAFTDAALHTAKTCVEVMTEFTGISLPLKKLDHLAVPYFRPGAMENWGLIIYNSKYVLYDSTQDTIMQYYNGINVRCHEIAHQWFGNYVTADWWSDLMLHESFATYFQNHAMAIAWPNQTDFIDTSFIQNIVYKAFDADTLQSLPVITDDGEFGDIVYNKGAVLLRMLSAALTPKVYRDSLRNYLTKYAYGNADHNKLWDAMTEITIQHDEVTDWCGEKMNVSKFMNPWIIQSHYPILMVSYDNQHQSYQIKQQPFVPTEFLPDSYDRKWPVPLKLMNINGDLLPNFWSNPVYYCPTKKNNKSSVVSIPWTSNEPMIVNPDTTAFARVYYDVTTFDKIIDAIEDGSYKPSAVALIRMIQDELAIVHRNQSLDFPVSYERSLKIMSTALNFYEGPSVANVFLAVNAVISEIRKLILDRAEVELTNKYYSAILSRLYYQTSWDLKDPNNWDEQVFKSSFFLLAVKTDIANARDVATTRFNKCGSNFTTCEFIPNYLQQAVYCAAALNSEDAVSNGFIEAFKTILKASGNTSNQAANLAMGVACSTRKTVLTNFISNLIFPFNDIPVSYLNYLSDNTVGISTLYSMLPRQIYSFTMKPNALEIAFNVLTATWYTEDRIAQLKTLQSSINAKLELEFTSLVNSYITELLATGPSREVSYSQIILRLYDMYAPNGPIPWTTRLGVTGIAHLTYDLTVQPFIPSYSYQLNPSKHFTYDASITIKFSNPTMNLTSIKLNSHRQILKSVSVNVIDSNNTYNVIKIERNFQTAIMNLILDSVIPMNNRVQINIIYSGFIFDKVPNEGIITNYDYSSDDNLKHWILTTDFEGGPSTRSLAPSFDEPNFKGRWTLTVIHPTDYTALSNTLESSITILVDGLTRTSFKQTNLMSSYLLALTLGEYSSVQATANYGNILIRVQTWKGMERCTQKALHFAVHTVNYLSGTLGVTQPLEKIDILALPQYSGHAAGAMENWGLIIAGYKDVLVHPQYTDSRTIQRVQNLVAHELTHQWFGDLVTMDWWDNLFLNEAFATYWPPIIMESDPAGDLASASYWRFKNIMTALKADENPNTAQPVVPKVSDIDLDWNLFSTAVYSKGASILATTTNVLSESGMNLALDDYLRAYSFRNSNDSVLLKFLDGVAKAYEIQGWTDSPLSVTDFLTPYLRQWSAPLVTVTATSTGIELTQRPLTNKIDLPMSEFNYLWNIPLRLFSPFILNEFVWLTEQSLSVSIPDNAAVFVNSDIQTYARVTYDTPSWLSLYAALTLEPFFFEPEGIAKIIDDQYALARNGIVSWERFLNATTLLNTYDTFLPWYISLTGWIPSFTSQFRFSDISADFKTYLIKLMENQAVSSLTARSTWAYNTVTPLILQLKLTLGDSTVKRAVSNAFLNFTTVCQYQSFRTGYCNSITPDYRPLQFIYGLQSNPTKLPIIQALYNSWATAPEAYMYFANDADYLIEALAASGVITNIHELIAQTFNNKMPLKFFDLVAKHDDTGLILFNYMKDHPNIVQTSTHFYSFLSAMTSTWTTDAQTKQLADFNWKLTLSQQLQVYSLLTKVNSRANWMKTHGPAIGAWLKAFNVAHSN